MGFCIEQLMAKEWADEYTVIGYRFEEKQQQHRDIYQRQGDRMQGDLASWLDQDRPLLLL